MLSVKAILIRAVEQGRRAVLLTTRSRIHSSRPYKGLTLTETQTGACRPRPKDAISHQRNVAETTQQNSNFSISSGRGIINLLRPVTSRLVQGLVRRVSSPLWVEARRKSAKRLFGETAPYFALVGVTLVSGPERGLLTVQDELEAICGDIREAISRAGWIHNPNFWKVPEPEPCPLQKQEFSLTDFELGPAISKGCSAVVYAAKWKEDMMSLQEENDNSLDQGASRGKQDHSRSLESWESLLPQGSLWLLNNEELKQEEHLPTTASSEEEGCRESFKSFSIKESPSINGHFSAFTMMHRPTTDHLTLPLSSSCPDIARRSEQSLATGFDFPRMGDPSTIRERPYRWKIKFKDTENFSSTDDHKNEPYSPAGVSDTVQGMSSENSSLTEIYPLAVKMMFNYEAESNAPAILTAMYKEMLPARTVHLDDSSSLWMKRLVNSTVSLPPHPNIVEMPCVFVDRVPSLADGLTLYPDALPKRINPGGYGRNMSLFCVMKRYDCTLAQYLSQHKPTVRTSLLLLTQLMEAVNHINKYGIVHRDIKCDNVLLCVREGMESPRLVVSDFGCCLVEPNLRVGFSSYDADPRVGNAALMPPEIKLAAPGMLTWLNYSKADLWAIGTLAYEIFGLTNPFISSWPSATTTILDSVSYKEALLPKLPKAVPAEIRYLIQDLLRRNPKQRPSPTVAATICQLSLWCPRKWLSRHALTMPSTNEVMRWLLCMSSKVLCEAGCLTGTSPIEEGTGGASASERPVPEKTGGQLEYEVISTFLKRVNYNDIIQALLWIRAY